MGVSRRHAFGPRAVLALGIAGAAALCAAAALDFGDPAALVLARAQRSVEAEVDLVRLEFERRLRASEPFAEPLGQILESKVPAQPAAAAAGPASGTTPPAPAPSALAGVFDTLLDAALAAAASGDTATAIALVSQALADDKIAAAPERVAQAHLRALAWRHALGDGEAAAAHRAALFELPVELAREGLGYHFLAALAGEHERAALVRAHAGLAAGAIPLPRATDRVHFDAVTGLGFAQDPLFAALESAAAQRAPDLDWDAALHRAARERAALDAWLPAQRAAQASRWCVFSPAQTGGEPLPAQALAAYRDDGGALRGFVTTREHLTQTLARMSPSGLDVRVGTQDELAQGAERSPKDSVRSAAALLPGMDLWYRVQATSLGPELAAERRRVTLLRAGLVALGGLVALTALLAARALARERRLAELRSTFVASVSHDLRTPLASMLLLIDNLEHGRVATSQAREKYHAALRQETERLRRMVEGLLDASRVERGQGARVTRVTIDTAAYLDELERALIERAAVVGARVSTTRGALPQAVHLDPDAVRRAVWNLFENALRHGQSEDGRADVRIDVHGDERTLCFEVADSGPGVPARHREAIFEPFERLADRQARRGLADDAGTGLGLAIVRSIARSHGGDATCVDASDAHSVPGRQGARFKLELHVGKDGGAGPEEDAA